MDLDTGVPTLFAYCSLVSIKQMVENDIRTQRCVLVMGGGGGANGGGGGGSVALGNACSDE